MKRSTLVLCVLVAGAALPTTAALYFLVPWYVVSAHAFPFVFLLGVLLASDDPARLRTVRKTFLVCVTLLAVPYAMVFIDAVVAPGGGANIGAGLVLMVVTLVVVPYAVIMPFVSHE